MKGLGNKERVLQDGNSIELKSDCNVKCGVLNDVMQPFEMTLLQPCL